MTIKCFRWELPLMLGLVVLGTFAAWSTINRQEGFALSFRPYQDLYNVGDLPRIQGFDLSADHILTVRLANAPNTHWRIYENENEARDIYDNYPSIHLMPGRNRYRILGKENRIEVEFWILWSPKAQNPTIARSSIPIQSTSTLELADFVEFPDQYSEQEKRNSKQVLKEAGISNRAPPVQQLQRLASFLHKKLKPYRGVPKPYMRRLSGIRQYEEVLAGRSQVYCANHARIFAYLANTAGIPTRLVDVSGRLDGVNLGAHSFVESFIDDLSQWIYVDLQLGVGGIVDGNGRYLNSAELLHRISANSTETLKVLKLQHGKIIRKPYSEMANAIEMYVHPQAILTYLGPSRDRYSLVERSKRLFVKPPVAYSLRHQSNGVFLRLAATYAALVSALIWLSFRLRHRLRRCKCYETTSD